VELIAHRAANRPDGTERHGGADLLELDVHLFRGRLEVRHEKVLWPTARLWERWYVLPRGAARRSLHDVLRSDEGAHLLLDLKGVSPRLARSVVEAVGERRPLTVATKSWWLLRHFQAVPGVRTFRSVGNRFELALLRRLPSRLRPHGVVAHQRLLSASTVSALRSEVQAVWAWGAPDRAVAEQLRSWGVDGLILDDPQLLRELRRARDGGLGGVSGLGGV
jgi:glycerophosphoryl diester phosphodiesterase